VWEWWEEGVKGFWEGVWRVLEGLRGSGSGFWGLGEPVVASWDDGDYAVSA